MLRQDDNLEKLNPIPNIVKLTVMNSVESIASTCLAYL
jgi:hypothetical protein